MTAIEKLAHIIYTSKASSDFNSMDLKAILRGARLKNERRSVTGMLLYVAGTFFQVLEGEDEVITELYATISRDSRHGHLTKIIQEPIAHRTFGDWKMGYLQVAPSQLEAMDGFSDFFQAGHAIADLPPGRAKKLLLAFAQGRWRSASAAMGGGLEPMPSGPVGDVDPQDFSFAFQPIVDTRRRVVYSHEALVRGLNGESAGQVLQRYAGERMRAFDTASRSRAIEVATRIDLHTRLNLNFLPSAAASPGSGLDATIEAAEHFAFPLDRITLEVTEGEVIHDLPQFVSFVNEYRRSGMQLAIDDFGAGYAGLNMLAEFQPDQVKLDMALARGIQTSGPRQAIVRAIAQVCTDLGIDLVVEGVETIEEYGWFHDLGVELFQGYLFAKPMFEAEPLFTIPQLP